MKVGRRQFLAAGTALGIDAIVRPADRAGFSQEEIASGTSGSERSTPGISSNPVDFRYSPFSWQTVYCFPDDHHKSLVGNRGELRYGNPGRGYSESYFPIVVEFSIAGMERDNIIRQQLEAPAIPVVQTFAGRPEAFFELTTFATRRASEGRIDNVIFEIRPRSEHQAHARPVVRIETGEGKKVEVEESGKATLVFLRDGQRTPFMILDAAVEEQTDTGRGLILRLKAIPISDAVPGRWFFRFPQEGQSFEKLASGLMNPRALIEEARLGWQSWKPFGGEVAWNLPSASQAFLIACARNIQQAREVHDGKLTFQVGPTVYRGLWIADGNFILEAARYLGYDRDAQAGLETEWSRQEPSGAIFAGAGTKDWKDTGIAMFTLVRQAELSQDWRYFREMKPQVLRAAQFLISLRDQARRQGGIMGHYGLLPPGLGDGGLDGTRPEFTNTLWALVGVKAVVRAAEALNLAGFEGVKQFGLELEACFLKAAKQEMRRYATGFEYLPMLMKEDPQWQAADPWDRPRPQTAQWALSQAIYPGLLFQPDSPIVKGHIALMQACTREDVPAETGWLHHGGLWTYNAAFVAHVYLWAGLKDWARLTFGGFLNHASPLYCWREEQPLQGSLVARYVGDMPHNWASAECILYLRHMLLLEDGSTLRVLPGVGDPELQAGDPYVLRHSPTRFGRVDLWLEALEGRRGWRLRFRRGAGPEPERMGLPSMLGSRWKFVSLRGAQSRQGKYGIWVSPRAASWEAVWSAS